MSSSNYNILPFFCPEGFQIDRTDKGNESLGMSLYYICKSKEIIDHIVIEMMNLLNDNKTLYSISYFEKSTILFRKIDNFNLKLIFVAECDC